MTEIHQDAEGNIVVNLLRPMNKLPDEVDIILFKCDGSSVMGFVLCGGLTSEDGHVCADDFVGWLPMPVYKPEKR